MQHLHTVLFFRQCQQLEQSVAAIGRERDEAAAEAEKWKSLYEALEEKISPFKVTI